MFSYDFSGAFFFLQFAVSYKMFIHACARNVGTYSEQYNVMSLIFNLVWSVWIHSRIMYSSWSPRE